MKILIIGSAGAGKTVLAVELGALLDLPVIHLVAVVFLAQPRRLCLYRVLKRTLLGQDATRLEPRLREQLPDREFLGWIWTYPSKRTAGILEMLREIEARKKVVILRASTDVTRFVESLRLAAP